MVQYRGEILPLVDVARVLRRLRPRTAAGEPPARRARRRPTTRRSRSWSTPAQGRRVGLVVGRILDIVEETIVTRSPASRPGVLFTAVVQGRVTEFLDVEAIVRSADPDFVETAGRRGG